MLNLVTLRLLSDPKRLDYRLQRFFLRLFTDYDLTHYRVLTVERLAERYKIYHKKIAKLLDKLMEAGLLEHGPVGRDWGGTHREVQTYRVPHRWLLLRRDFDEWIWDIEQLQQREGLFAPEVLHRKKREARPKKKFGGRLAPESYQKGWKTRRHRMAIEQRARQKRSAEMKKRIEEEKASSKHP